MTVKISRRQLLLASSCAAVLPSTAFARKKYKSEYKLSVVGNPPLGISSAAVLWADLVRERTDGRVNMKPYTGSQLVGGDSSRELVGLRQGTIDMLVSSSMYLAPQVPEMNLFSLPFLLRNEAELDALTQGGPVRDALDASLAKRGAVTLAWSDQGFRQLINSRKEIRNPDDLKGMKIRFPAGQIYSEIFEVLGANPLQMAWVDLQPALATGAVDGMETPVNDFIQSQLDTVNQKYMTLWGYVTDASMFKVASPVWDRFSAEDQEIIRQAAIDAAKDHVSNTRKGTTDDDRSSFEELERRGVTVTELTEEERTVFADAARPVFDKWANTAGTELVQLAEQTLNKMR